MLEIESIPIVEGVTFNGITPQTEIDLENIQIGNLNQDFVNPTVDNPVRIGTFLRALDLGPIEPTLNEMYADEYRFKFPMMPALKTMIYWKLSGHKFLTDVWRELLTSPNLADDLGYDEIPDYNMLYHFLNKRLGSNGIKKLFDAFVEANKNELAKHGIILGEEVGLDATPIPAKQKDEEAGWNHHYDQWCYLWHNMRCIETNLPLEFHITNGREDEAHFFAPFLMRLQTMKNIHPNRIFVDGGYTGFENIARSYVYWDIDIVCNIAKDWQFSESGTLKEIERWYQKLWKEPYFKPNASFMYKLYALMLTDDYRFKQAGMYFRNNEILCKYEECSDGYVDCYHQRNKLESHHGTEKRNTEIKYIEAKGIERTTTHIGMHIITLHAIALCRLQHGITENLTDTAGLI